MTSEEDEEDGELYVESALLRPGAFSGPRVPGYNLDRIDVGAGMRELIEIFGSPDRHTEMVIEYALQRWARGEEEAAERGAIDKGYHGVDMTTWRRVLAAARAGGELAAKQEAETER